MRIKLKLELNQEHRNVLPINNRYETSSWIYKIINQSDAQFGKWLHDNGYRTKDGKAGFKFFTFSDYVIPKGKYKVIGDRMVLNSRHIYITVSFYINNDGAKFIMGLFKNRKGEIGDILNTIKFNVAEVTSVPEQEYTKEVQYRCISPVVLSKPEMKGERLKHTYISPAEPGYKERFVNNLIKKASVQNIDVLADDIEIIPSDKHFRSLIKIAGNTKRETSVVAYKYYFKLQAPESIHKLIAGGVGELCSQGFGCVEVVD